MPAATRRNRSPVAVDEDVENQEMEEGSGTRLQFKQPLTWRAGRPIPVADLLRRLEALSKELQTYDQDEVEKDSLATVAKELVSQQLITHKDRGVKAYVAACLVDIFRLCAPDAPYTGTQLKVNLSMRFNYSYAYHCPGYLYSLRAIRLPCTRRPIQSL
jgi:sister-chromatid-cohesion protein PDS5